MTDWKEVKTDADVPKTGIPEVDLDYKPAPFGYVVKAAAPWPWEVKGGANPYPGVLA
jgi:hypothetical protein